ncbi:MAG: hypothetical protein OHK0046_15660 [Anaerolineae bacterium]
MSHVKQLRSRDPEQRKDAIKAVAREVDRNALRQLAILAGDDPEEEIRDLARRAGVYIRQKIGELPPPPDPKADPKKPPKIPVDAKDAAAAQNLVRDAMTGQIAGDKGRMVKSLTRALKLDPNLRHDAYFVSLVETAVDTEGEAALERLNDAETQKQIEEAQAERLKQAAIEQHRATISSATWQDAALDAATFFVIVTVGLIIALFVMMQSAQGYLGRLDANQLAVEEARLAGRVKFTEDGQEILLKEEVDSNGNPLTFTQMIPDPDFVEMAERTAETSVITLLLRGLGMGVLATLSVLALAMVTFTVGARLLRGESHWPYLTHKIVGLLISRTVTVLLLSFIVIILIFSMGGNVNILYGLVGLFAALSALSILSTVRQAFKFSLVPGLIATSTGFTAATLILGVGTTILL